MTNLARGAATVFLRQSLPSWRDPSFLLFGMLQPLIFLAFFGPLLGGVLGRSPGSGWQWFVPAVLIMLAVFGTTATGYSLLTEMQTGSHERMLVTPINRAAMLVGRVAHDVATLLVQAAVIIAVMVPFGFRLYPLGATLGLGLLALLGVAVGALSHALAIACRKHHETFYMVQQTVQFPVVFLSGLMLPLELGPGWMQTVGRLNPFTAVVEALRALFAGELGAPVVVQGTATAFALAALGLALGTRALRRSST